MLASSKESLTHLHLCSITLTGGSWRNILSLLAREYRCLTSFKFDHLREEEGVMSGEEKASSHTLDFGDARDNVPDAYRQGLNLTERPRCQHKPVCTVKYDGCRKHLVK
jgi:ligand-binding sensor domain-containing protein